MVRLRGYPQRNNESAVMQRCRNQCGIERGCASVASFFRRGIAASRWFGCRKRQHSPYGTIPDFPFRRRRSTIIAVSSSFLRRANPFIYYL